MSGINDQLEPLQQCVAVCCTMLAQFDLPEAIRAFDRMHAIGPVLDPTLYRDKSQKLNETIGLLRAAQPLWVIAKRIQKGSDQ